MYFASDNTAGAHPDVLKALVKVNSGFVGAYGDDPITAALQDRLRAIFEHDELIAFPIATGSSGNALALATMTPGWGAVYCHGEAHINVDECGAPEVANPGSKLVPLDGNNGKFTADSVMSSMRGRDFVHAVQPSTISVTNLTEVGSAYTVEELQDLGEFCRKEKLSFHMDGARFANALVSTNASPADLTWRAGVDVLTFGATKNGCMAAEAVIFFDPDKAQEFAFRRKRAGHLFSKMRFLSGQLIGYIENDLWLQTARHANAMAAKLARGLVAAGYRPYFPVEGNMVFAPIPEVVQKKLKDHGAVFYPGRLGGTDGTDVRLLCSWSTTQAEVDKFVGLLG